MKQMRKKNWILGIFLVLALSFAAGVLGNEVGVQAQAASDEYYLGSSDNMFLNTESAVNDYAGIFTPEETASFEKKMAKMSYEYDCNVVAFIIDRDEWDSSELSAPENVASACLNTDAHKSTVVLWLNISPENRSLYVLGYGSAQRKITDGEADDMAEDLQDYVKRQQSGDQEDNTLYVEMMNAFIEQADTQMRRPYFFLTWWFQLILGVIAGTVVVFVLLRNVGGKMTTNGTTYMNKTFSKVLGRRDIYTHTTYVRTEKSSSSGGSGGGGSHSSGGGRF